MSLRTKINGFTAWVNLRLTPYNQLLNNVLMDLLSGTHMKYFVESFTGRDLKRVENFDGLSQQQMETRVGWVVDELKKCSILPDDVYVDSRLFAMRSADHVFDLLWRLISHDIWFLWERAEYLQVEDLDVLTQVPFKWTPEPPPKKKKSKKSAKKSLLSGFGPGSMAAEEKSEDGPSSRREDSETDKSELSKIVDKLDDTIEIDSDDAVKNSFDGELNKDTDVEDKVSENDKETESDQDCFDKDELNQVYEEYHKSELDIRQEDHLRPNVRVSDIQVNYAEIGDDYVASLIDDLAEKAGNLHSLAIPHNLENSIIPQILKSQNIQRSDKLLARMEAIDTETKLIYQNAVTQQVYYDGKKKCVKISIEPIKEMTDSLAEHNSVKTGDPVKQPTEFLKKRSRVRLVSSPIISETKLSASKSQVEKAQRSREHRKDTQNHVSKIRPESTKGKIESKSFSLKDKKGSRLSDSEKRVNNYRKRSLTRVTTTRKRGQFHTSRCKSALSPAISKLESPVRKCKSSVSSARRKLESPVSKCKSSMSSARSKTESQIKCKSSVSAVRIRIESPEKRKTSVSPARGRNELPIKSRSSVSPTESKIESPVSKCKSSMSSARSKIESPIKCKSSMSPARSRNETPIKTKSSVSPTRTRIELPVRKCKSSVTSTRRRIDSPVRLLNFSVSPARSRGFGLNRRWKSSIDLARSRVESPASRCKSSMSPVRHRVESQISFSFDQSGFFKRKGHDYAESQGCLVIKKLTEKITSDWLCEKEDAKDDMEENWVKFPNAEYVKRFKKKKKSKEDCPSPDECILEMVNYQLKITRDGKGLFCYSIDDFVDSRVLCALVNSFVPNTFTADLLLNDRWTINMALKTAEKMFYAETPFDAEDLVEADPQAVCAYFAFFLMVAYRYRQTTAVVNRVDFINRLIREGNHELEKFPPIISNMQEMQRRKDIKAELERHKQALEKLEKKFDVDFSRKWVQHAEHVQNEVRREIRDKMRQRFDIVEVPRNITINDFCLAAVVNLSLTNGSGFYLSTTREQLSEGRKLVLRNKETKEFIEDFTNKSKATIKDTLRLPDVANNVIEINPASHPNYEFYFEAQSRNKQLKAGTHFLYQVFPGNTVTWQRLFIKSARENEYETMEKMIAFFREHSSFINCREPKSGNTALHNAARSGHFEIVRLLLENGADIDQKNNFRCTALNFAIEALQRKICHYLIEWGCDVMSRNIKNQSVLETIKNDDFKRFAMDVYNYYSSVVPPIMNGDMALLDKVIADHISKKREFCCLRSRCINGSTLLHTASYYGHLPAIRELLAQRVDVNLRDYKGSTPLHRAKTNVVMETLLEAGASVNAEDSEGNTVLHVKCYGETNEESELECIKLLLEKNVSMVIRNSKGLLPIHCCAMQGRIDVMKVMMEHDQNSSIATALNKEDTKKPPSLLHLAIANDFIECAQWLLETGFHFKENEPDILMRRILTDQIRLVKRADALKFLLDNGADANPRYPGGNTALHYASGLSGPTDVLELLINYGAEIDVINEEGCTPLFFATQSNNQLAACVLIEHGANVRHKNSQGLTALDHIVDFEEWIECGYFTDEIKARLKAYNLKHSRDLIRAISKKVKPQHMIGLREEATRSAYMLKSGGRMSTPGVIPAITFRATGSARNTRYGLLPPVKMIEGGGNLMF